MIFFQKNSAEEHIKGINKDNSDVNERVMRNLRGSVNSVEITFPQIDSFLMEFIQNADDAKSQSIFFQLNKKSITVYNDGEPFQYNDAESISSIGQTSKKAMIIWVIWV